MFAIFVSIVPSSQRERERANARERNVNKKSNRREEKAEPKIQ
jgi:hypothetical protein